MDNARILVADDEIEIRKLLAKYLEREGYAVDCARSGDEAVALAAANKYDLAILDIMMPGLDGFEACARIRKDHDMPILFLSARDGESDKVSGLVLGADDYVTKPFSVNELVARVRAHLRRARMSRERVVSSVESRHGIVVDLSRHEVRKDGAQINLTPKEFDLLVFLMRSPGQVFTKSRIFQAVWGDLAVEDGNTVMVHIRRLRTKIESDPSEPAIIQTVHGIGYCFADV